MPNVDGAASPSRHDSGAAATSAPPRADPAAQLSARRASCGVLDPLAFNMSGQAKEGAAGREHAAGRERAAERSKDKLIVRWLPSKLTEEEFRLSVQKWEESIMWLRFEAGTVPEGAGQRPTPGCAYLQLCSAEVAAEFSAALDGAGYRDSGGMVSRCMVEWAPCQRVPGRVPREDARVGTLEQDDSYKAFVEDLTTEKPAAQSAEAALEAREKEKARDGVVVTPLLQYLRDKQQRAAAKKAKEQRAKQAAALKERQEKLLETQREARRKAQEQRLARKEAKKGGEKKVLATPALVKAAIEEAAVESAERKAKGRGKGAGKAREARAAEAVADEAVVSKLVEMGFARGHAAAGVRANQGKSEEQVVQWLVEHPPKDKDKEAGKGEGGRGSRGGGSKGRNKPDQAVYRPGKGGRGGRGAGGGDTTQSTS
eukprot:Transcript_1463.p1 GENE.Transcript_1463~~Transcript_1463.p1  ORF type:complete len:428 (+),score=169.57 Transcript_1463:22-1305(+)